MAHGVFFKVYVVKVSINYIIVETKEHLKTKGTTPQALLAYIWLDFKTIKTKLKIYFN